MTERLTQGVREYASTLHAVAGGPAPHIAPAGTAFGIIHSDANAAVQFDRKFTKHSAAVACDLRISIWTDCLRLQGCTPQTRAIRALKAPTSSRACFTPRLAANPRSVWPPQIARLRLGRVSSQTLPLHVINRCVVRDCLWFYSGSELC